MRVLLPAALSLLLTLTALPGIASAVPRDYDGASEETPSLLSATLMDDPLYVGPVQRGNLEPEQERALRRRLRGMEPPVHVALVGQSENMDHYSERLAYSSGTAGYYFVVGADGRTIHGARFGLDDATVDGMNTARLAAETANGGLPGSSLAERLDRAVDLVESGTAARAHRFRFVAPALVSLLFTALLGIGTWFGVRRWSRRPVRVAPLTAAVTATVGQAQEEEYRTRLGERLTGCGQRVSAHTADDSDRIRTALEAYTAAAKILDSSVDKSDLVGVQVLLDMCEAALNGEISPAHCFFDPRHTGGKAFVRWRAPASFESVKVLACRECRQAVRQHRTPPAVLDSTGERPLPYYAVPPENSVWAATGYGTLVSDLPGRIMRGDHRG